MLRLALRNLLRNRRRTLLAVLGVALALAFSVTSRNWRTGVWTSMLGSAISGAAGHVVVQAPGWQEERDAAMFVPQSGTIAQALREAYPDAVVVRRVMIAGLLTSPRGAAAVGLSGVEHEAERALTLLDDRLVDGGWLDGDGRGVLVGRKLADALQVGVGDKVVFMGQVGKGEVESVLLRVRGIYVTGSEQLDALTASVDLSAVQPLLHGDDGAHQIAVVQPGLGVARLDPEPARAVVQGADVLVWEEAMPALAEQLKVDKKLTSFLYLFLGLIVAVGVLNTVLMGALERTRELGVMLSLGMRPARLAGMVLLEGLLMGVIGAACGLLLAASLYRPLYVDGVDFGDLLAKNAPVPSPVESLVRASVDVPGVVVMSLVAIGMTVLASVWPAWSVSRLQPVEAMRKV
ncbi:MAG TPA: FtsX-like permease family protein [Myxococcota bacterium]|nr:FtsX-like permease family protein [Myxococcota bacterium]